ncbi:MAG: tetratricopeptide repeat protein [Desulfobacteraceae bacterium]|nr:MAG: tetratricopeptide repeat protein [Desulfobacteraceae bacterium]
MCFEQHTKELDMHRFQAFIKTGACMAIGCLMLLALVPSVQAEYTNPALPDRETFAYWMDQGGFFCTYGNFKAAVRAYEKALGLSPDNAEAHFNMGLALCEMGDFTKARGKIDKAIALRPDEGRYRYGRGWLLLLSGRPDEARPELLKAAELGSTEARNYIQHQGSGR